jgi:hypothetical protein
MAPHDPTMATRRLRWSLLALVLLPACDPNPNGPSATPPPAPSGAQDAPPKVKPQNRLIDRD